jgi:hypothetical protein
MDRPDAFNLEKNQDSRGGLITSDSEDKEQDSRGDLNNGQAAEFVSSPPIIVELATNEIQPFQIIPDYDSSTNSPYPIVVKSPTSCHCIDGWDNVESALIQNQPTLTCHVFYIPEYCETEIAIRKVSIRTMPQGGTCSYAELVRNAGILFKMLLASSENPVVFSHGGQRKGPSYAENTENDVRKLLANRLGKSVTTISKYLNHGEFLNDEAKEALITAGAEKKFFEAAQPYKQKIISKLRSAQNSETDITAAVSESMLVLLKAFQANKSQQSISVNHADQNAYQPVQNEGTPPLPATSPDLTSRSSFNPQKIFQPWNGNNLAVEEHQITEHEVRREIKTVGSELMEMIDRDDLTAHQIAELISAQMVRLAKLFQQLKHLDNLNNEKMEENDNE